MMNDEQMSLQPRPINPFILTLMIDEDASVFFDQQRQRYFPAALNFLQAHLTLFHYLPLPAAEIIANIRPIAAIPAFKLMVTNVVSLGKGVAYKIESGELQQLHYLLQQMWKPLLKPQDLQKLWPHITVQNKVASQQAKDLLLQLKTGFQPFFIQAVGLSVWEYLNGPWRFIETVNFFSVPHP